MTCETERERESNSWLRLTRLHLCVQKKKPFNQTIFYGIQKSNDFMFGVHVSANANKIKGLQRHLNGWVGRCCFSTPKK